MEEKSVLERTYALLWTLNMPIELLLEFEYSIIDCATLLIHVCWFEFNLNIDINLFRMSGETGRMVDGETRTIRFIEDRKDKPREKSTRKKKLLIFSTSEVERIIKRRLFNVRAIAASPVQCLLIPQSTNEVWGQERTISKKALLTAITGENPFSRTGDRKNEEYMDLYLQNIAADGFQNPEIGEWGDYIPMEAPIIDYLAMDTKLATGWRYPRLELLEDYQTHRGAYYRLLDQVELKEVIVNATDESQVESIREWMLEQVKRDQEKMPAGVVAMEVGSLRVSRYDELKLLNIIQSGPRGDAAARKLKLPNDSSTSMPAGEKDGWRDVPARIMIGNGRTWAVSVSLDISCRDGENIIKVQRLNPAVLDLIRCIPVCTGFSVRSNMFMVERFYSELAGQPVTMKGCVSMDTLVTVAGVRMKARSSTCLGVQLLGCAPNTYANRGDRKWGRPWRNIPKSLQVYLLNALRVNYTSFCVISGTILRNTFPDPEIVCAFLGCFQAESVSWFCNILVDSIRGLEVDIVALTTAVTRADLLETLRERNLDGTRTTSIPERARIWLNIAGSWPCLTYGGCRFLFQARNEFVSQVEQLRAAGVSWSEEVAIPTIGPDEKMYATLSTNTEGVDWSAPVTIKKLGLVRHPECTPRMLTFDPKIATGSFIVRKCLALGAHHRFALYEWALRHPELVDDFLARMVSDAVFMERYENYYDPLRLIYWRSTDKRPRMIPAQEERLNARGNAMVDHEWQEVIKARELADIREKRWRKLVAARMKNEMVVRARWRQALPSLPGWKHRTRRQKRKRNVGNAAPCPKRVQESTPETAKGMAASGDLVVQVSLLDVVSSDDEVPVGEIGDAVLDASSEECLLELSIDADRI